MITAKLVIFAMVLGVEYITINGILEYLDAKKYGKEDEEYELVMQQLKSTKKGAI